jgi:rod shape determining protein RodA
MIMGGIKLLHLIILAMPLIVMISSVSRYLLISVLLILFLVMIWLKVRLFFIILLTVVNVGIGISSPIIWDSLHPYQQQRIKSFIHPEADPQGAGYQVIQSKIAVGSGGFSGKGYLKGTQGHLKFLPAGHTDFIFSVLSEELGFIGAAAVILSFLLFSYRSLVIAGKCRNKFSQLVIVGGTAHFASHALVNIGMAIGMMPVTGLPLPFMSYGGSALLLNMTLAGIMVSLGLRWREY